VTAGKKSLIHCNGFALQPADKPIIRLQARGFLVTSRIGEERMRVNTDLPVAHVQNKEHKLLQQLLQQLFLHVPA
jgi:hypothetical protein